MKTCMNLLLWTGHVIEEHFPLLARVKAAGSVPTCAVSDSAMSLACARARSLFIHCRRLVRLRQRRGFPPKAGVRSALAQTTAIRPEGAPGRKSPNS